MPGGGMRGGGMRGGGMRGAGAPPGPRGANGSGGGESIQDRLAANDTKAYLDAEALLDERQRERARELASDYREKLYDRREADRGRAAASK